MCRFVAYLGHPILTDELLFKPTNSLINQSIHALEAEEPLNGDGFGLGWYSREIDPYPAIFTSIQPAWNNRNLAHISPKISSTCFFAHVRAASTGDVSELNCHPFYHDRLLFMHNGSIHGFETIKRYLRQLLSDKIYEGLKGQTDSEHFFALFLEIFKQKKYSYTAEDIAKALQEAIDTLENLKAKHNAQGPTYLNVVISDGSNTVAVRFSTDPTGKSRSLHCAEGSEFKYDHGKCHIVKSGKKTGAVLIVSEKLTSYKAEWNDIPLNHMVLVHDDLTTQVKPL